MTQSAVIKKFALGWVAAMVVWVSLSGGSSLLSADNLAYSVLTALACALGAAWNIRQDGLRASQEDTADAAD